MTIIHQENLSNRLRLALKIRNFSQTDLAKKINVKPQIIQYLCAGQAEKSKFTFDIAEALEVDVSWLATGKGVSPAEGWSNKRQKTNERTIPVLSLSQIKNWRINHQELNLQEAPERISVSEEIGNEAFATILTDKSMAPRFDFGTIIIIDPSININKISFNHRFVLVYLAKEDFIIFRQLEIDNDKKTLIPLNNNLYNKLPLETNDVILGLCKEARWHNFTGANHE